MKIIAIDLKKEESLAVPLCTVNLASSHCGSEAWV
jgi:hypothetical protein